MENRSRRLRMTAAGKLRRFSPPAAVGSVKGAVRCQTQPKSELLSPAGLDLPGRLRRERKPGGRRGTAGARSPAQDGRRTARGYFPDACSLPAGGAHHPVRSARTRQGRRGGGGSASHSSQPQGGDPVPQGVPPLTATRISNLLSPEFGLPRTEQFLFPRVIVSQGIEGNGNHLFIVEVLSGHFFLSFKHAWGRDREKERAGS